MKNMALIAIVAQIAILSGCGGNNDAEVQACVDRGVSYFKEMGSYPTLSSPPNAGRNAEEVAKERCNRGTTAF